MSICHSLKSLAETRLMPGGRDWLTWDRRCQDTDGMQIRYLGPPDFAKLLNRTMRSVRVVYSWSMSREYFAEPSGCEVGHCAFRS